MKATSQRTILFRQSVDRTNEQWAHFLEGYRKWLIDWDMKQYGDDWHTAEDIASEIFLEIIKVPLVINMRPKDSFRHTLLSICRRVHRDFAKPWRKDLHSAIVDELKITSSRASDNTKEIACGYIDLVIANLEDESLDGGRPYLTFSFDDLNRWRTLRKHEGDVKKSVEATGLSKSTFSKSCKKVNCHVVSTVKEIIKRLGLS